MPGSTGVAPLGRTVVLDKPDLGRIIDRLWREGYTVVGPTIAQGAIIFDEVRGLGQLPIGWTDEQEGGTYRLKRRDDGAYFGYAVGPHSWKKYLFPSRLTLFSIETTEDSFAVHPSPEPVPRYAFLGARSCDLHAIEIQDRVFLQGPHVDPHYQARREPAFIIAVNCAQAAATCFCTSMKTGPKASRGFDLALTELPEAFLVEMATDRGRTMMADIPYREATGEDLGAAARVVRDTEGQIHRRLDTSDLPDLLYNNLEHPRWDDVADRCLSCTNCTMVCPTCFCHSIEDVPDLGGQRSERVRLWDSCFNLEHAHTAGGNLRPEIRSRYRQWLTHKLASWIDQYGVSGCVGLRALHHVVPGGDRHHRGSGRHPRRDDGMTPPVTNPTIGPVSVVRGGAGREYRRRTTRSVRIRRSCGRSSRRRPGVATFSIEFQDQSRQEQYRVQPGQFNMIYVPGVGEVPISVSDAPREGPGIGHTIRFVGRVTHVIEKLGPGAVVGLRGPYGRGWPMEAARGRDVAAGGRRSGPGPAAARRRWPCWPTATSSDASPSLYGARHPADLLYTAEYPDWERRGMEISGHGRPRRRRLARAGGRGARPLQPAADRPGAHHRADLRPGDPDAVHRHRGPAPRRVRPRHLLLDGAEHAVRGRDCAATASSGRRSSARTGRSSRTGELAPFFRQELF